MLIGSRFSLRSNILVTAMLVCVSLCRLAAASNQDPPLDNICSFDNANYTVGQSWRPFLVPWGYMPCIKCVCEWKVQVPSVSCNRKKCQKLSCPGAYTPYGECCMTCPGDASSPRPSTGRGCLVAGGARKRHGEVWTMAPSSPRDNQCTECSCMDSFVSCAVRTCPNLLTCRIPVPQNGTCCLTCGCSEMGRHYNEGDVWRPELGGSKTCVNCTCKNSQVNCRMIDCPPTDCEEPVKQPGDCCAKCPERTAAQTLTPTTTATTVPFPFNVSRKSQDCLWYNKLYLHGSSWNPTVGKKVEPCVVCSCMNTSINCGWMACPTTFACAAPKKVLGTCCAVCPGSGQKVNQTLLSPKNRRSTCSRAKYHWQVFEYVRNGTNHEESSEESRSRALFVLVDPRASAGKKPKVELHKLEANATNKFITVWAVDASLFRNYDKILRKKGMFLDSPVRQKSKIVQVHRMEINTKASKVSLENEDINDFEKIMNTWHKKGKFEYIGTINEGRRKKIMKKERELCSGECLRGVQVLIRIVKNRSKVCQGSISVPPDTLLMLNEG